MSKKFDVDLRQVDKNLLTSILESNIGYSYYKPSLMLSGGERTAERIENGTPYTTGFLFWKKQIETAHCALCGVEDKIKNLQVIFMSRKVDVSYTGTHYREGGDDSFYFHPQCLFTKETLENKHCMAVLWEFLHNIRVITDDFDLIKDRVPTRERLTLYCESDFFGKLKVWT